MSSSEGNLSVPDNSHLISSTPSIQGSKGMYGPKGSHTQRKPQRRSLAKFVSTSSLSSALQSTSSIVEFRIPAHTNTIDRIENAMIYLRLLNTDSVSRNIVGAFSIIDYYEVLWGGDNILNFSGDSLMLYSTVFASDEQVALNQWLLGFGTQGILPAAGQHDPTLEYTENITIPAGGTYDLYIPVYSPLNHVECLGHINNDVSIRLHLNPGSIIYLPVAGVGGALTPIANVVQVSTAELLCYGYEYFGKNREMIIERMRSSPTSYKFLVERIQRNTLALAANQQSSVQLSLLNGSFVSISYWLEPAVINANVTASAMAPTTQSGAQYLYSNVVTGTKPTYRVPITAQNLRLIQSWIVDSSGRFVYNLANIQDTYYKYVLGQLEGSSANAYLDIYNSFFGNIKEDILKQTYEEGTIRANGLWTLYFICGPNLPASITNYQLVCTGYQAASLIIGVDGNAVYSYH